MSRTDLVTVAAVATALVLSAAASLALVVGAMAPVPGADEPTWVTPDPLAAGGVVPSPVSASAGELVVDVEGGVVRPGVHRLPAGARVADALAAAGGYAPDADLAAAARSLNLAAPVADGQQIYVPRIGEGEAAPGVPEPGLVNLNHATQDELEALPGIGPVTAGKIISARAERPFTSLDELVARDVLTTRQLEQIADLVTVT